MKTQSEIEKRLEKLRKRYRKQYVQERTGRHYLNCVHNHRHVENPLPYDRQDGRSVARAKVSLTVVQEQAIHICMYDPKKSAAVRVDGVAFPVRESEWAGDVCDEADKRAPDCPWFKPAHSEEDVGTEFDEAMSDVEFVFDNYRDVAALQWVLDIRGPDEVEPALPPSLWERFLALFRGKPVPQLPAPDEEPVTEPNPDLKGLWDAGPQDPRP